MQHRTRPRSQSGPLSLADVLRLISRRFFTPAEHCIGHIHPRLVLWRVTPEESGRLSTSQQGQSEVQAHAGGDHPRQPAGRS